MLMTLLPTDTVPVTSWAKAPDIRPEIQRHRQTLQCQEYT